ncbi:MAG: formyltetrahydrofolate deformylase [Caulobacteraceae bacterium]|nr:formyltetrahydrofolate deformylase [Caulobacteraceae bacterium]
MTASETQSAAAHERPAFLLTLSCPDRVGIVADVSRFLVENDCNILESAQYGDAGNRRFFFRTSFEPQSGATLAELRAAFTPIAAAYDMKAEFFDQRRKTATIIMVSKFGHCLNDLLFRWRIGALPIDIKAVISNHTDFASLVEGADLPFIHMPVTPENKADQAALLGEAIEGLGAELVVLARYMQVLPAELCARYPGRIINIHHSFLPSFKGARPYHAAYKRGVKLIGATAHYVTEDLDEGPIVEQSVERVQHSHSVADYIAVGRDVEALVLARAVKWHAERRVLLNGQRTVVFQ